MNLPFELHQPIILKKWKLFVTEALAADTMYVLEWSFRKVLQERPTEWANGFISYHTEQAYGMNRSLSEIEGTIGIL